MLRLRVQAVTGEEATFEALVHDARVSHAELLRLQELERVLNRATDLRVHVDLLEAPEGGPVPLVRGG